MYSPKFGMSLPSLWPCIDGSLGPVFSSRVKPWYFWDTHENASFYCFINSHFRNLNWRYLPYIRPKFQGISPQNMAFYGTNVPPF